MKCDQFRSALAKFKVGDVVYLYMPGRDESQRLTARIVGCDPNRGLKLMWIHNEVMSELWYHPRQCMLPKQNTTLSLS